MISAEALSALVGFDIAEMLPIAGGGNSRVVKVVKADGGACAAKFYPPVDDLGRDRLATEWTALAFLTSHGVAPIPEPVARHDTARLAVYGWIEGGPVGEANVGDIDQALAFIATLHKLGASRDAISQPDASEACFCAPDIIAQIGHRLHRYREIAELHDLLRQDIQPLLDRLQPAAQAWEQPLAASLRVLSPSDFGFHNAVRRPDGSLGFVDFEYFGWDDPVKLVADMLWHPAMHLGPGLRRRLVDGATAIFADDTEFARRLAAFYPLYGLRWCMIMLAEFLPERWAQRVAAGQTASRARVLDAQLAKVRYYLARIATLDDMLDHDGRHTAA